MTREWKAETWVTLFDGLQLDPQPSDPKIDRLASKITKAAISDARLRSTYDRAIHTKYKADQIVYLMQAIAHALEPLFWNIAAAVVYDLAKAGAKNIDSLELERRIYRQVRRRVASAQKSVNKVRRYVSRKKLVSKSVSDTLVRYSKLISSLKSRGPAFKRIVRAIKKKGAR